MKQAATIELFSYWDSLRAGLRRELLETDATEVRTMLASTFLVEADDRRAYPLRVIGGTLARLTSHARIGASFLECWQPQSRDLLEAMLRVVHDERLPAVIGARAVHGERGAMAAECLLLPILSQPGGKPRILGGMAPSGVLNRRGAPVPLEIVSARVIRKPAIGQIFAWDRGESPPAPMPAVGEPVAHLRVIEGGRI